MCVTVELNNRFLSAVYTLFTIL